MTYNPTMRLLTILELLQSNAQISATDLAQKLEVEKRSIRRYITMLRDAGIPIESERGRYGGYTLRPGFRLPPMMFNHDELVAIMAGLLMIEEMGALPALAIESATTKIERVLPDELFQKSQALRKFLTLDLPALHTIPAEWLLMVNLAAFEEHCLFIEYISASGKITERVISPAGVVLHGRTWYIPAYCHLRDAQRIFRLDRVQAIHHSNHLYRTIDCDPKTCVLNALATMPDVQCCEILLHADIETVAHIIPASMAILEENAGNTIMRCYTDDTHWLARFLAGLEIRFTVQKTEDLRNSLTLLAKRLTDSI